MRLWCNPYNQKSAPIGADFFVHLNRLRPDGNQQAGDHPDELVQQHIHGSQQFRAAQNGQQEHDDHTQYAADDMDRQTQTACRPQGTRAGDGISGRS